MVLMSVHGWGYETLRAEDAPRVAARLAAYLGSDVRAVDVPRDAAGAGMPDWRCLDLPKRDHARALAWLAGFSSGGRAVRAERCPDLYPEGTELAICAIAGGHGVKVAS